MAGKYSLATTFQEQFILGSPFQLQVIASEYDVSNTIVTVPHSFDPNQDPDDAFSFTIGLRDTFGNHVAPNSTSTSLKDFSFEWFRKSPISPLPAQGDEMIAESLSVDALGNILVQFNDPNAANRDT